MGKRRFLLPLLAGLALMAVPASSQALTTGLGDETYQMFANPAFKALHTKIARYIAPYNAWDRTSDRVALQAFVASARLSGITPLIAFWHSSTSPNSVPSTATYKAAVTKVVNGLKPLGVREYQAYNEANRGTVSSPGVKFRSPSAKQAAAFYESLRSVCTGCTVVGLDVLDASNIAPTLRYIKQFKRYVKHMPRIWGLHNYSDTNRHSSSRTAAVGRLVPGELWLTETGGIVKFGHAFPGGKKGLTRAATALKYMFSLARHNRKVKRLYIFQWTGAVDARFDAGLTNPPPKKGDGLPRPGYAVVYRELVHKTYRGPVANNTPRTSGKSKKKSKRH